MFPFDWRTFTNELITGIFICISILAIVSLVLAILSGIIG